MTPFQQLMCIPFMQCPRNQQYNIINLIRIRDIVKELCEIAHGLSTEVIEFFNELFGCFVGDGGGGDRGGDVGEKSAVFCCRELQF